MALREELQDKVREIFVTKWAMTDGIVVPDTESLTFDNVGKHLEATVLYADLADSTNLVDSLIAFRAAEIYKTYLYCAGRIINAEGGTITAYDGDRVMAIFTGDSKNTSAVTAAIKINWALINIINPSMKRIYTDDKFVIRHSIGVDTSVLLAVKTGVRGDHDLVWVGRSANHAAKLTTLPSNTPVYVTKEVYDLMNKSIKYDSAGANLWSYFNWERHNRIVYYGDIWMPV